MVVTFGYRFLFRQALFREFLFRHAVRHGKLHNVNVQLSQTSNQAQASLHWWREISRVGHGIVRRASDSTCSTAARVTSFRHSFDAITHAAITPTDNKGRLEPSRRVSQFSRALYKQNLSLRKRAPKARGSRRRKAPSLPMGGGGVWGLGISLPSRLGVWGSVVSSPSGVLSGGPAANEFVEFYM